MCPGGDTSRMMESATPDLLILDDLGLRALVGEEPMDLYEVIRQRYERASTILTSNRAIEELVQLFTDPLLASAAMDRLLHRGSLSAPVTAGLWTLPELPGPDAAQAPLGNRGDSHSPLGNRGDFHSSLDHAEHGMIQVMP